MRKIKSYFIMLKSWKKRRILESVGKEQDQEKEKEQQQQIRS